MQCLQPRHLALLLALPWLNSCGPVTSSCPPIASYAAAEQAKAADELALVPANGAIVTMLSDYAQLRAEIRACKG